MLACLLLIGLIAFATATSVATDVVNAAVRSCTTVIHLLFGLAAAHLLSVRPEWRQVWPFIVAGVSAYILTIPIFIIAIPDVAAFDWVRFGYAVTNIRQTGFYAAVGASAAIGFAIVETRRDRYVCWIAVATLSIIMRGRRWPWQASIVLGILGSAVAAYAYAV